MFACLGVLMGVLASVYVRGTIDHSWLIGALILMSIALTRRQRWTLVLCIIVGVLLGLWRGVDERQAYDQWKPLIGRTVVLSGRISEDVTRSRSGEARVVLTALHTQQQTLRGDMWVTLRTKASLRRSDVIVIKTVVAEGFGSFAASAYSSTILKHRVTKDESRDVRDAFAQSIRRAVNEPFASLGIGFLVGQKSSLPTELEEQLRVVGLTHIIVASGYNLTVLLRMARRLFARVSKYLTALSGGLLIGGFILMTGMSPSMTRAGMVAGLSLAAWYYGRNISPFMLLLFVAAISVLWKPMYLWADVGWCLSFAAFIGVMIISPLIHDYFYGNTPPSFLRQISIETTAALAMTVPISLAIFQSYALYALPANIMVVPLVPYAMLLTFFAGIGALLLPNAAPFFGAPAELLLRVMRDTVEWWSYQPGAAVQASIDIKTIIMYYLLLCSIVGYFWYVTKHNFRSDNIIE
jgi:competence protein ComEC